jgi:hypothetical protein
MHVYNILYVKLHVRMCVLYALNAYNCYYFLFFYYYFEFVFVVFIMDDDGYLVVYTNFFNTLIYTFTCFFLFHQDSFHNYPNYRL